MGAWIVLLFSTSVLNFQPDMKISYKDQIRKIFDKTKSVLCPAFDNGEIIFNAKGINI